MSLGLKRENIVVSDAKGVVYLGRTEGMDPNKARYARDTSARTLAEVIPARTSSSACRPAACCKPEMVKAMARDPIILAMANPMPEIMPEDALAVRPDAVIGTGRSDYPNQVNNVLCFPFIFRGALDVGATTINEAMKLAAVRAIAELTHAEIPEVVAQAYGAVGLRFGRDYLIPKPFDPRLIEVVAPAVAQAAMDSGVATRPIADMPAYRQRLSQFVYQSGSSMQPLFAAAKRAPKRVVYAEGEDERVLRAAQVVVDEGLARPLLLGRPEVIAQRIAEFGLRLAHRQGLRDRRPARRRRSTATRPTTTIELKRRDGVSRAVARSRDAQPRHAAGRDAGAPGPGRRDAVRHLRQLRRPPAPCARRDRSAPGREDARRDADADAARTPALHRATPTSIATRTPSRWPRSRCSPPRRCAASASRRAWRCCRTRASAARTRPRR